MKVLFVVPEILLSTPLGLMQLSAICKKHNHETKLALLKRESITKALSDYNPDIIAYSTMTPDANLFPEADNLVKKWISTQKKNVFRIMGGPHPTYFPEVLEEFGLDAICIGEGDNAILGILDRIKGNNDFSQIPNVLQKGGKDFRKELITDLDELPFVDREIIYDSLPYYRSSGLRSFLTSRGCPYSCTYCYNHLFNEMFRKYGKIIRRRSVNHVIEEIKFVIKNYPPVKFIRFADDTFAHTIDQWLLDFSKRYKKEIGIPFYCLMRSNTMTEDMAKILAESGCKSMAMGIETGDEYTRNKILKRNIPDKMVRKSFGLARKYNINTYGNTMLALPGTTVKQDFDSFLFTKSLKLSAPTFGIFSPYPKTELTQYAIEKEYLDKGFYKGTKFGLKSVLNCYTEKEKEYQIRLAYLAPLFCSLPDLFIPSFKVLLKLRLTKLYSFIGAVYVSYLTYKKIFPNILPKNIIDFFKIVKDAVEYSKPKARDRIRY